MAEARTFGRGGRAVEEDRSLVLFLAVLRTCRGRPVMTKHQSTDRSLAGFMEMVSGGEGEVSPNPVPCGVDFRQRTGG